MQRLTAQVLLSQHLDTAHRVAETPPGFLELESVYQNLPTHGQLISTPLNQAQVADAELAFTMLHSRKL